MAMLNIAKYLEGTVEMAQWLRVQMTVFGSQHMSDSLHQPITPAPENKMISSSFQGHTLPWAHIYMHSHMHIHINLKRNLIFKKEILWRIKIINFLFGKDFKS